LEPFRDFSTVVFLGSAISGFFNLLTQEIQKKQEMMYNYKAELTGILSRSYI